MESEHPLCRFCHKPIMPEDQDKVTGYWAWGEYDCHKQCKEEGLKEESYLCQCIDADCNDCGFFQRGEYIKPPYKYFKGFCLKLNKPTNAFAVTATLHVCFLHRKDKISPCIES